MASFATKLEMILKALSITRGRAAAEMGVDKPLVGRWVSGAVHPSARNLERLTIWIAGYHPGFTLLDWDLDIADLAKRFGVAAPPAARLRPGDVLEPLLAPALIAETSDNLARRGWAYEGFWRATRPSALAPGKFLREHLMISCNGGGAMMISLGAFAMRLDGYAVLFDNQMFVFAADSEDSNLVFAILNLVARLKADVLDGLILTRLADTSGSPVAMPVLLERVGDLSGNDEADRATFETLCAQSALVPSESVPDDVRQHLCRDFGPAAAANGGGLLLVMRAAESMARGPEFEVP
jgi:transcriptional regulator with XRE-family HTH domain